MQKCEKFKVGETLKSDIGRKLNMMVDRINRDIKGDGRSVIVTEFGNALTISAVRRGGGGGGGGASVIIPTFKIIDVSEENAPAIRIVHGSQSDPSVAHTCGYVYADNYYSIPAETISLTAQSGTITMYVVLKTTYDTDQSKYVFELLVLSSDDYSTLVNNSDRKDVFILGYLRWANDSFSILQTLNIYYYDLRALYWV